MVRLFITYQSYGELMVFQSIHFLFIYTLNPGLHYNPRVGTNEHLCNC